MKRLFILVVMLAALGAASGARAQSNPPFQNPSLDSDCYFPQIGVPGEIDTIYGSYSGEGLGAYIHNLGPKPDGSPGNLLLGNANGLGDLAPTGPNFDLHNLHAISEALGIDNTETPYLRFGHFRDQSHLDLFDGHTKVIYWSDDYGHYSSNVYTQLVSNIYGDDDAHGLSVTTVLGWYITHLTSDSVDDIVGAVGTANRVVSKDSMYLVLFRGGQSLFGKQNAYEDTSLLMGATSNFVGQGPATIMQGDFRGNGRMDLLIADEKNNILFFKDDPPFSLAKLLNAMIYDTIWSKSPIPNWRIGSYESLAMHALPKKKGDSSDDLVIAVPISSNTSNIAIFRGGPDFGSHRITIDSAAFVITPPRELGETNWPDFFNDAGDITNTGNHLLYVSADNGIAAFQNFYLTGQALDSKIDIFNSFPAGALDDSMTANADSFEDNLLGLPGYATDNDRSSGKTELGSMWLLYGSKQIPVHLNPEFADVKNIPLQDGAALSFYPNPATRGWSVATIVWPEAELANYDVYNLLGAVVQTGTVQLLGGAEQQRISFPHLANGVYEVFIHGSHHDARAKLVIVR